MAYLPTFGFVHPRWCRISSINSIVSLKCWYPTYTQLYIYYDEGTWHLSPLKIALKSNQEKKEALGH